MNRLMIFVKRSIIPLLLIYAIIVLVATLYPFSFNPKNNIASSNDGGIRFSSPAIMYTDSCPTVFLTMNQFSFLFRFSSGSDSTTTAQTIFTNSINSYDQNFTLQQIGTALVFRIFNRSLTESKSIYILDIAKIRKVMWCAIVYDGDMIRCFIDGVKISERRIGVIECSSWDRSYPLVVGSDANGYHSWDGTLYSLLIFDTVIPVKNLRKPEQYTLLSSPALSFDFNLSADRIIRSRGADSITTLRIPETFIPFRRTVLLESTTAMWKRRLYLRDIIGNIFMFMPLGFLIGMLVSTISNERRKIILFACVAGFVFSISIELLQVYQPGRFSSVTDVLSNICGAYAGAVIYFYVLKYVKIGKIVNQ